MKTSRIPALWASLTILLLGLGPSPIHSQTPSFVGCHGQLRVVGNRIVDAHGQGIVLRGMSMYAWASQGLQYYNATAVARLVKEWKCTVLRIPILPGSVGGQETLVRTVVDACIANGIYAIIDWHSMGGANAADCSNFMKRMASSYGNTPNVMYETWNEPVDETWPTIKAYHEQVIAAIRSIDPDNIIFCGDPQWDQNPQQAAADPITDFQNIAYVVHFYAASHGQWLIDRVQQALNQGAAIFATEYGTSEASGNGAFDPAETQVWWNFLDANGVGHTNWSMSALGETSAALNPGSSATAWTDADLKPSGVLVKAHIVQMNGPLWDACGASSPVPTDTLSPTPTWTSTPTPVVSSLWRVNAGGPSYTDGLGNTWSADTNFTGGTPATVASAISGTTDDALYQTERYGNPFTYSFAVPAGSYQVTLKFAETWTGITAAGQRVFNVSINGTQALTGLDIFAEVGLNSADDKVFNNIRPDGNGRIVLQFGPASANNAKVDAIQIIPQPATPTATLTSTPTRTSTPTPVPPTDTSTSTRTTTPVPPTVTRTGTNSMTPTVSATRTDTPAPPTNTFTAVPPTATYTNSPIPPTATNTPVPPTATFTNSPVPPTSTGTGTMTPVPATFTSTVTRTPTSVPPTSTWTAVPPTSTATLTFTWTNTLVPPTSTSTWTAVPPTATSTNSPIPPTQTFTNTPLPPTATNTPVPPTATLTRTPAPPTATPTSGTVNFSAQLLSADTSNSTNSPHPQIQVVNTGSLPLALNNVTVKYWFNCDCTNQTIQTWVDWAGLMPSGTGVTGNVHVAVQPTSLGGQTNDVLYSFTGNMVLQPGQKIQVQSRFNKSDWSAMLQSNDWSFMPNTSYQDDARITGYLNNALVWGQEPLTASSVLKASSLLAYPNPSTGNGTDLKIDLAGAGSDPDSEVTVQVYTLNGRLVWSRPVPAAVFGTSGEHVLHWDEKDRSGGGLANGVYLAVVAVKSQGQDSTARTKILVLR